MLVEGWKRQVRRSRDRFAYIYSLLSSSCNVDKLFNEF